MIINVTSTYTLSAGHYVIGDPCILIPSLYFTELETTSDFWRQPNGYFVLNGEKIDVITYELTDGYYYFDQHNNLKIGPEICIADIYKNNLLELNSGMISIVKFINKIHSKLLKNDYVSLKSKKEFSVFENKDHVQFGNIAYKKTKMEST